MREIWKDVQNYKELYQISNLGRIKSLERLHHFRGIKKEKFRKLCKDGDGYAYVCLCKNGKRKNYKIARLVASYFLNNDGNKLEVNHKDGNKLNNLIMNLEWVTRSENVKHSFKIGLKNHKGENGPNAKLTNQQVKEIRNLLQISIMKQKDIAKIYNVRSATISHIKNNKIFVDLNYLR